MLLCGKPPIRNKTLSEIRNDTIEGKLPAISDIRKHVPRQLQAITYKAMQKDAKDRYPTALDLAMDVERYLADEPVSAYQDSVGLKVARLARRHRSAAQATVLGLCGCLIIAGLSAVLMGGLANSAQKLRDRNLASSSQFMARSIGQDIDRIWRVLEFEANQGELRSFVTDANQRIQAGQEINTETESQLQQWLETRLKKYDPLHTVTALFVLSNEATQLARAPLPDEPQIGENFAYRDYFTGIGYDLAKGSRSNLSEPLTGPMVHPANVHMSVVYKSTLQDEQVLKVTFTVPIWDPGGEHRIGVIGTSVSIGDIMPEITDASNVWLADLRDDYLENNLRQRGLLLQHPDLDTQDLSTSLPRLSSLLIEQIQKQLADGSGPRHAPRIGKIADPRNERLVQASIVPITIDGRGEKLLDLNWIVVTAEREAE